MENIGTSTKSLESYESGISTEMQLRKLTLFSSGVGFFEYSGEITGNKELKLPFSKEAINDVLKTIVINDPDASPTVSYHSEQTLLRTMSGLSINLHEKNHIAELLKSLKGAEIEVFMPNPLKGRIMLVEFRGEYYDRYAGEMVNGTTFLSLLTDEGIRIISLKEISGFTFSDPRIQADANRALDLILQSRDTSTINLAIRLPGENTRKISLSYVIPMPLWKISYRLDLSRPKPLLQGWAVIDNDSDSDWEQVELSLVTGKPTSFIQNLYEPHHLLRPTLPLSIAGIAKAKTYESGTQAFSGGNVFCMSEPDSMLFSMTRAEPEPFAEKLTQESMFETASASPAGDMFAFTIKNPVSLSRQQSAMVPLVESAVDARRMVVFSGSKAPSNKQTNPAISAEIVNNTGMKLPAGPIAVYDGGTYAGDALTAFFPEGEKRIIAYGEDLSVTGSFTDSANEVYNAVTISQGVMILKNFMTYERRYTFKNASGETKRLIVEHPIQGNDFRLVKPTSYMEKTGSLYRFELELPPGEAVFEVKEERLLVNDLVIADILWADFEKYSSNQEFPENVRTGFQHIITLKQKVDTERESLSELQDRLEHMISEQERTRKNLEVAGSQTQQGQSYLKRLASQDADIDALHSEIATVEKAEKAAKQEYDAYIQSMSFDENRGSTQEEQL